MYQSPIEFIKSELFCCWLDAKNAHSYAMKNEEYHQFAATYALSVQSHLSCIKSVYTCNYDEIANDVVESLINQFTVFTEELLTSYCTNHSHQWTDLEFSTLKDLVASSGLIEI